MAKLDLYQFCARPLKTKRLVVGNIEDSVFCITEAHLGAFTVAANGQAIAVLLVIDSLLLRIRHPHGEMTNAKDV